MVCSPTMSPRPLADTQRRSVGSLSPIALQLEYQGRPPMPPGQQQRALLGFLKLPSSEIPKTEGQKGTHSGLDGRAQGALPT